MSIINWPEIALFHNIRKYTSVNTDVLHGENQVIYYSKIKLHGANCAIQCHNDGRIIPQSRTIELSLENDFAGFAKWIKKNEEHWNSKNNNLLSDMVIYGEWIGNGINKDSVAVSSLPKKVFAVFAARPINSLSELIIDPVVLDNIVKNIPDTYTIPWYNNPITIDWSKTDEELSDIIVKINDWVSQIELNDPWVQSNFGINGTGEGLVFYPISESHLGLENFSNLAFKAKGEKHRVIKSKAPTQLSAESAASITEFVDMVLTEARLDQGTAATDSKDYDMRKVGKFLAWVIADVQKEAQDELDASGLDWKQVQKSLSDKARTWYLNKAKAK